MMLTGRGKRHWIVFSNSPIIFVFLFSSCKSQKLPEGKLPRSFPYAMSSKYVIHLANSEVEIYKEMKIYAKAVEKRLAVIQAYLKDYEDSSLNGTSHLPTNVDLSEKASAITAHPILAFRLISRFAIEFDAIGFYMGQDPEKRLGEKIMKLTEASPFLTASDVQSAMQDIFKLQYFYDLKSKHLASGNLMGVTTGVGLSADLAHKLGEYAAQTEYYCLAMEWFKETEDLINDNQYTASVSKLQLASSNKLLMEKHDRDFEKNKNESHLYMFTKRLDENPKGIPVRSVNYAKIIGNNNTGLSEHQKEHYKMLALCNGEYFQSPKYMATLKCSYERPHPYFYLFPLKAELLNHDPPLIQYHDVLNEQWSQDMKRAGIPNLGTFHRVRDGITRPTVQTNFEDEVLPTVPISKRIELITGLHFRGINASQELQVNSYTYRVHGLPHFDCTDSGIDSIVRLKGDCLGIFIGYMTTVDQGGRTAFIGLGTHVKPIKGSAVLWYNILKNGEIDKRTKHVACPILSGGKWITIKRNHLFNNFLKRPCDLNPNV